MTCDCLFSCWTDENGTTHRSPYLIDPDCEFHGIGGSERCAECNSIRLPCGCEKSW